ncbi:MAG: hypothetical protein FWH07_04035 [Oscillospiraceae bacterium]|nr:hypothetical protein [Oscillospiraceae bacterium]
MKKSILAILFSAAVLVSAANLTACNGNTGNPDNSVGGNMEESGNGNDSNGGIEGNNSGNGDNGSEAIVFEPIEIPIGYEDYLVGEFDFSVAIPENWELQEYAPNVVAAWLNEDFSTENARSNTNITVSRDTTATQVAMQSEDFQSELLRMFDESYADMFDNFESEGVSEMTLGYNYFLLYTYTYTMSNEELGLIDVPFKVNQVMSVIEHNMVTFTFAYPAEAVQGENGQRAALIQNEILSTLRPI